MLKSNCVKEKCRFYDDVSECAIDCCMYGASVEDEERGILEEVQRQESEKSGYLNH